MKKIICIFFMMIFAVCFCGFSNSFLVANAAGKQHKFDDLNISSKSAFLIDYNSGTVIFEKNANDKLPVASMTKLASLAVVFDAIEKGAIKLTDMVCVSKNAANIGGSSAFLDAGSSYKVEDLIKTIVIASANDSCVALAEFVSGSEELFVLQMNKIAKKLNLRNTNFENCTGLPSENHYSSAYDMAQIYKLVCDNEVYKKFSKIWMEDFVHPSGRKTELVNTNRLIKTYDGIDSGKTGYTDSAKFCLTASATRSTLKLIGVVIGTESSKLRFEEMRKLFDYGFANYKNEELVNSKIPVTIIRPKFAINESEIYPKHSISKLLKKSDLSKFSTDFEIYDFNAPKSAGDIVGKMFVFDENNMVVDEVELVLKQDIDAIDFGYNLKNIFNIW